MALAANALVTLETVLDELGLTSDGGTVDARLERYIATASDMIEAACQRTFRRASITDEPHAGYEGPCLVVDRPPINSTVANLSITYGDSTDAISTDSLSIHDAGAGIIYNPGGWTRAGMRRGNVDQDLQVGTEEKLWKVDYDGGFVTGPQAAESGGDYENETVTLPGGVEQACIDLVKMLYKSRLLRPGVTEQRIGDASEKYGGGDARRIPASVREMLAPYVLHHV